MVKYIAILLLLASCNVTKPVPLPTPTVMTIIDGSKSKGMQLTYQWRIVQGTGNILTPNSKISKVTFNSKGTRIIELTVKDNQGQTDKATMSIIVQ